MQHHCITVKQITKLQTNYKVTHIVTLIVYCRTTKTILINLTCTDGFFPLDTDHIPDNPKFLCQYNYHVLYWMSSISIVVLDYKVSNINSSYSKFDHQCIKLINVLQFTPYTAEVFLGVTKWSLVILEYTFKLHYIIC